MHLRAHTHTHTQQEHLIWIHKREICFSSEFCLFSTKAQIKNWGKKTAWKNNEPFSKWKREEKVRARACVGELKWQTKRQSHNSNYSQNAIKIEKK